MSRGSVLLIDVGRGWIEGKHVPRPYPHLGMASVAASLARAGFGVRVVDQAASGLDTAGLLRVFDETRPVLVGLSSVAFNIDQAYRVALAFRRVAPDVAIILGGAHATALPRTVCAACEALDVVVQGEGEKTAVALALLAADRCRRGRLNRSDDRLNRVPGLFWRDTVQGKVRRSRAAQVPCDPGRLAPVDWTLYDYSSYLRIPHPRLGGHVPLFPISGSRGCPFRCSFCFHSQGWKWRPRPPAAVVAEMRRVIESFGPCHFDFTDSNATTDRDWFLTLCRELRCAGLQREMSWNFESRADLVDPELLSAASAAGAWLWCVGIESGDDALLAYMDKGLTVAQCEKAVSAASAAGLDIKASFILGHPGETPATLERTLEFAAHLRRRYGISMYFNLVDVYPATPLYDMVERGERGARWLPGMRDNWPGILRSRPTLALPGLDDSRLLDAFNQRAAALQRLPADRAGTTDGSRDGR